MGLHGLKNKPSRNSFDLSHRNLFTAKVGELLPCFVQEVNPGDSLSLEASYFTRTAPLQSAAFTRLRENIQYFFVPYSLLWKYFNNTVMNMTKNAAGGSVSRVATGITSNAPANTKLPYINYADLHHYLFKLLNNSKGSSASITMINGCYRHCESARLLQLLGYGNFREQYALFNKDLTSDKLVDDIGATNVPNLSVFRLLAYHKICNDHYLYSQWQPYNASLCNIDYITPSSNMNLYSYLVDADLSKLNLLDMRFSNLPLDYFNGVLPTPQFGSESVANLKLGSATGTAALSGKTGTDWGNWSYSDGNPFSSDDPVSTYPSVGSLKSSHDNLAGLVHFHNISGSASINTSLTGTLAISALRNSLALQKYKEVQLAADADFVSQVEAHFGYRPKHDSDKSIFIGGASSMIDINPVVNQNLQGTGASPANLPHTMAAPTGSGTAKFKFTADTYGVVIGIYRCTPVLDYEHSGIDRTLLKTDSADFVIPELDSIGMQSSYQCEVYAPSLRSGSVTSKMDMSLSFGYAPRYSEYKVSYDRYNGAFGDSLKSWVTGLSSSALVLNTSSGFKTISVPDMFVCRPDIVGSIFLYKDFTTSNYDPLYVGLVNMCYATRNLSRYGLPYSN